MHGLFFLYNIIVRPLADHFLQALELVILLAQLCILLCATCMVTSAYYPFNLEFGMLGSPGSCLSL